MSGPPQLQLFMVEHDLRNLSLHQQSSAHQSLEEAVSRVARRGSRIRYVQRVLIPEESRCLCLFEAAGAELVRSVNDIAQFPLTQVLAVRNYAHPGTAPSRWSTAEEDTSDGGH